MVLLGTFLAVLSASVAWGSNLTQVRVGAHGAYTRVVLQLDGSAAYELTRLRVRDDGVNVLFVEVDAAAANLAAVPVASPHLKGVKVGATEAGKVQLRVRLAGEMELKELVLREPDRIVLDFYPSGSGVAPLVSALTPPELGGGTVAAAEPVERPSIDQAHDSEFDQALRGSQADSPRSTQPRRVDPPVEEAQDFAEEAVAEPIEELAADLADAEEALEAEVVVGGEMADEALEDAGELAEDAADAIDDAFEGVEIAEVVPEEPAPTQDSSSPPAYEGPSDSGSTSLFGSPITLAALAGLAIVGLVVVLGRRKKDAGEDDASLSPLDAADPDDIYGAAARAQATDDESAEALFVAEAVEEDDAPAPMGEAVIVSENDGEAQEQGLFDAPDAVAPATETDAVDEGMDYPAVSPPAETPMSPSSVSGGAVPINPGLSSPSEMASGEVGKLVEEFERRIAHLETRLEEVVDAKERLERQVAAQTEELRVQRAAIARTQRVLRTIARPEDEGSEPSSNL